MAARKGAAEASCRRESAGKSFQSAGEGKKKTKKINLSLSLNNLLLLQPQHQRQPNCLDIAVVARRLRESRGPPTAHSAPEDHSS